MPSPARYRWARIGVGIGLLLLLLVVVAGGSGDPWQDLANAIATALISLFLAAALGILGLWIGSAVGAWVTLRARGFQQPGLTAVPLAVLFPIWAIFIFVVVISILSAVDAESGIAIVMALVLAALLAVAVPGPRRAGICPVAPDGGPLASGSDEVPADPKTAAHRHRHHRDPGRGVVWRGRVPRPERG